MPVEGVQVGRNYLYPDLQLNISEEKGDQKIPSLVKLLSVKVLVNGILGTRLLRNCTRSMLVDLDTLAVPCEMLDLLAPCQLAIPKSQPKVNVVSTMKLKYQGFDSSGELTFCIINFTLSPPWMC